MTSVITPDRADGYPANMRANGFVLDALLAEHRELHSHIEGLLASPRETLAAGEALLAFAKHEDAAFAALTPLLDPAVQAELSAEHQQIADDLELLRWLLRTTPDSPDLSVLTTSLVRRMRRHIDRDGRLLARAAGLGQRANDVR
ncbi:MAG TPA: hypothetical protein VM791_04350 [Vicinamibacterales bacterium]|jgi:hypothetical protein|nr:hypothetical protein [Vicinamibacterales bacterium]